MLCTVELHNYFFKDPNLDPNTYELLFLNGIDSATMSFMYFVM